MATFRQRGNRWQAIVRKAGHPPVSDTFATKLDAENWARELERRIDMGGGVDFRSLKEMTVADLMDLYYAQVCLHRKTEKYDRNRIAFFKGYSWSRLRLSDDIGRALRDYRDERLKEVKGQSINRDLNFLGGLFNWAMTEKGITMPGNPVRNVKRCKEVNGERDITWSPEELSLFLSHLGWDAHRAPVTGNEFTAWAILLARVTGMRRSEICSIEVTPRTVHRTSGRMNAHVDLTLPGILLPDTKNGEAHTVPLSTEAIGVLRALLDHRAGHTKLIDISADSVTTNFTEARDRLVALGHDVGHLHFHDLRHTWTSEMVPKIAAKGGTQLDMLRITGRRSVDSLARYYNPKTDHLAGLLG